VGFALNAPLAAILAALPGTWVWWSLYNLGATVMQRSRFSTTVRAQLAGQRERNAQPVHVRRQLRDAVEASARRRRAALVRLGLDFAGGLRFAFALVTRAGHAAAYAWFAWGGGGTRSPRAPRWA
jgi:hypothetical protein